MKFSDYIMLNEAGDSNGLEEMINEIFSPMYAKRFLKDRKLRLLEKGRMLQIVNSSQITAFDKYAQNNDADFTEGAIWTSTEDVVNIKAEDVIKWMYINKNKYSERDLVMFLDGFVNMLDPRIADLELCTSMLRKLIKSSSVKHTKAKVEWIVSPDEYIVKDIKSGEYRHFLYEMM